MPQSRPLVDTVRFDVISGDIMQQATSPVYVRFSDCLQVDVIEGLSQWVITLSVCMSVRLSVISVCLCLHVLGSVIVYK